MCLSREPRGRTGESPAENPASDAHRGRSTGWPLSSLARDPSLPATPHPFSWVFPLCLAGDFGAALPSVPPAVTSRLDRRSSYDSRTVAGSAPTYRSSRARVSWTSRPHDGASRICFPPPPSVKRPPEKPFLNAGSTRAVGLSRCAPLSFSASSPETATLPQASLSAGAAPPSLVSPALSAPVPFSPRRASVASTAVFLSLTQHLSLVETACWALDVRGHG